MYKYKTKEVFYNRLFYLLLGDNDVKLKNKICKPYIDEEQVIQLPINDYYIVINWKVG